jgi:flagellar motor switch protein FliM
MEAKHRETLGRIFKLDLSEIESIWAPIIEIRGSNAEFETNPEYLNVARTNDRVALIGFDIHFLHASGKINLSYSISLLEPVLPKLAN